MQNIERQMLKVGEIGCYIQELNGGALAVIYQDSRK
jgi:hypothetical protein